MSEPEEKRCVGLKIVEKDPEYETVYQQLITHPENFSIEELERLTEHAYKDRFDFSSIMALMTIRFQNRPTKSQLIKEAFLASMQGKHEEFERLLKIIEEKKKLGIRLVSNE